MRVLGVNAAGAKLWLTLVADDGPEDTDPPCLELSEGAEGGLSISAFRVECRHVVPLEAGSCRHSRPEPTARWHGNRHFLEPPRRCYWWLKPPTPAFRQR